MLDDDEHLVEKEAIRIAVTYCDLRTGVIEAVGNGRDAHSSIQTAAEAAGARWTKEAARPCLSRAALRIPLRRQGWTLKHWFVGVGSGS